MSVMTYRVFGAHNDIPIQCHPEIREILRADPEAPISTNTTFEVSFEHPLFVDISVEVGCEGRSFIATNITISYNELKAIMAFITSAQQSALE